jgi:SAM-dependent methyltransferase
MIRVLQSIAEVGNGVLSLQRNGLPTHTTFQKNWDHHLLWSALDPLDRRTRIVDLGCGDGQFLRLASAMGFTDVHGVDLRIPWTLRAKQLIKPLRTRRWRLPFRLRAASITDLPHPDGYFGFAACVSVIEHGVPIEPFLSEVSRILAPGGRALLTTDYWEQPLATDAKFRAFGSPWTLFDGQNISCLVRSARQLGLAVVEDSGIPPCGEKTVVWGGVEYTFIAIEFYKSGRA